MRLLTGCVSPWEDPYVILLISTGKGQARRHITSSFVFVSFADPSSPKLVPKKRRRLLHGNDDKDDKETKESRPNRLQTGLDNPISACTSLGQEDAKKVRCWPVIDGHSLYLCILRDRLFKIMPSGGFVVQSAALHRRPSYECAYVVAPTA